MISFMIGSCFAFDVSSESAIQYLPELAEHKESVRPHASLPSIIGNTGIRKVIEPKLTGEEVDTLKRSAALITQTIEEASHA